MIALDTHAVLWLYEYGPSGVPPGIAARLGVETVRVSPPARLELAYLHEVGRQTAAPTAILQHLGSRMDLGAEELSAQALFDAAAPLTWARDPFDRLICAHAAAIGADLATKDATIRAHFPRAVWDDPLS